MEEHHDRILLTAQQSKGFVAVLKRGIILELGKNGLLTQEQVRKIISETRK